MRRAVTMTMAAPVEVVWDLVSDVTRIGEFSPETFEAVWVGGATGPALGARFKGHVKRNGIGPIYWTLCEITDLVPGERFEFAVLVNGQTVSRWGYTLTAVENGTDVTEYFVMQPSLLTKLYWAALGRLRGRTNERGMHHTLERMRAVAEAA